MSSGRRSDAKAEKARSAMAMDSSLRSQIESRLGAGGYAGGGGSGGYSVQLGAFKTRANAEKLAQQVTGQAENLGYGPARIIFRHILPNSMAPIIVVATLGIGNTILTEAALSFLGLGVQPPTASWGSMVSDGKDALINAWWIATFPGLAIVLTVVCFNLLGDAARDALDPRLRS